MPTRDGKNNRHAQQDAVTDNRLENDFCFSILGPHIPNITPQLNNSHVNKQVLARDTGRLFVLAPLSTNDLLSFCREPKSVVRVAF